MLGFRLSECFVFEFKDKEMSKVGHDTQMILHTMLQRRTYAHIVIFADARNILVPRDVKAISEDNVQNGNIGSPPLVRLYQRGHV